MKVETETEIRQQHAKETGEVHSLHHHVVQGDREAEHDEVGRCLDVRVPKK
jgi:hypothetical protein